LLPSGVYYAEDVASIFTWTQNGPTKRSPFIAGVSTVPTMTEYFTFAIGPTRLYEVCVPQLIEPEEEIPEEEVPVEEEPKEEVVEDKTAEILRATAYVATSLTVLTIVALLVIF
jgi:hypothetical protein